MLTVGSALHLVLLARVLQPSAPHSSHRTPCTSLHNCRVRISYFLVQAGLAGLSFDEGEFGVCGYIVQVGDLRMAPFNWAWLSKLPCCVQLARMSLGSMAATCRPAAPHACRARGQQCC